MILVGAFCFILPSLVWGIFILAFRLRSQTAIGTIVGESTAHGKLGQVSAPIVEFELPDGRKITFTESTHSSESVFTMISDLFNKFVLKKDLNQISVIYDPKDPQKARVNTFTYLYFMPVILFVIGLCFILSAIPVFHDLLVPILNFMDRISKSL